MPLPSGVWRLTHKAGEGIENGLNDALRRNY